MGNAQPYGPYRTPRLQWEVRVRGGGGRRGRGRGGRSGAFLATDNEGGDGGEEGGIQGENPRVVHRTR